MSASVAFVGDLRSELKLAEPMQRADCSSVLRSEVREAHGHTDGAEAERGAAAPAPALPCLNRNNCIESEKNDTPRRARLTPKQKLIRCKIIIAVSVMVQRYGLSRVGVLTLSFGVPGSGRGSKETLEPREQAKEWEFVQKRWHSFCTNVIAKRYAD